MPLPFALPVFLRRRRSRRLAGELARRLDGTVEPVHVTLGPFETARVMAAATFEGMKLRLYVCAPWVHVEHWNFACATEPDLEAAINAPRPGLGLTLPVAGVAGESVRAYVAIEGRRAPAIRFLEDSGCRQAIDALALVDGEWLVVTARQAWLRCRGRDVDSLMARLRALAGLNAAARRMAPAGPPG